MKTRSAHPEKLDNLSLNGKTLHHALKSLEWINRWLGNHHATVKAILGICSRQKNPISIIDLGCGGGDLVLAVAKALHKNNIPFTITGIDGNANSLLYAQQKCAAFAGITFIQADILQDDFSTGPADILISSHFIYHFTDEGLVNFFRHNLPNITTAIICSELERTRLALSLFKFGQFLLPISKMAKKDGLLAIKRSFTKKEWLTILQQAGIKTFRLQRVAFLRIRLIIFPNNKL